MSKIATEKEALSIGEAPIEPIDANRMCTRDMAEYYVCEINNHYNEYKLNQLVPYEVLIKKYNTISINMWINNTSSSHINPGFYFENPIGQELTLGVIDPGSTREGNISFKCIYGEVYYPYFSIRSWQNGCRIQITGPIIFGGEIGPGGEIADEIYFDAGFNNKESWETYKIMLWIY